MVPSPAMPITNVGSYVEITGGKYIGHRANVTGFTPTGQCRIRLDHGCALKRGSILTKNSNTRCASHHVKVILRPSVQENDKDKNKSLIKDKNKSVIKSVINNSQTHSIESMLLARLVALELADKNKEIQDGNVCGFIQLVETILFK